MACRLDVRNVHTQLPLSLASEGSGSNSLRVDTFCHFKFSCPTLTHCTARQVKRGKDEKSIEQNSTIAERELWSHILMVVSASL